MKFQAEQISVMIVASTLIGLMIYFGREFRRLRDGQRPSRFVIGVVKYVEFIHQYTITSMGRYYGERFAAYMGSVFIYIILANWSGLLGLPAPTMNYSVTLALTLITWVGIQYVQIKDYGVSGYIKSFFEPFFPFVIPNIFGTLAPLVSMSLRIFGNIVSGSVLMGLIYQFTAWVSRHVPWIGQFNFIGPIVTPVLHMYFDLFAGFLQAFIFLSLSLIFIGTKVIPDKDRPQSVSK